MNITKNLKKMQTRNQKLKKAQWFLNKITKTKQERLETSLLSGNFVTLLTYFQP